MKTFFFIIILILVGIVAYYAYGYYLQNNINIQRSDEGTRIEGRITDTYNDLAENGNCGVQLGEVKIVIRFGGTQPGGLSGKISGIECMGTEDDLSNFIGKDIEFFGNELVADTYSVIGDNNYYLELQD